MAEVDLVAVEDSANDNGFLTKAADKHKDKNPLRPKSKKELVDGVLSRLGPGDCVKSLLIVGHGSPGNISTGDGQGWESCKHVDGNRAEWEPELQRLKGKFCAGATITLQGCNVGAEQAGADKLFELAQFFGVTVEARTGEVYGDGSSEKGSKTQRATPERKPAPIPKPADAKKKKG